MTDSVIVDRRQFIIMDRAYLRDDFLHVSISENAILSYQKELKLLRNGNRFLLGHAFSTDGKVLTEEDVREDQAPFWSGRWVLINDDTIIMDACGSLGVYYSKREDRGYCFSSSIHLLNEVLHIPWTEAYFAESGKGGIFDYYPIPCTPYPGIKKLLPTQCIDFNGNISFRKDFMIPRYQGETVDRLETMFIDAMTGVMHSVSNEFGDEVWFSLTGGYDSRCNVAVAKRSGIPFHAYTALRDSTKDYDLDKARRICNKLKMTHETIDDRSSFDNKRAALFDLHCGGHISFGTERQQFIASSDVPVEKKAIVLWGTLWAMSYYAYQGFMKDSDSVTGRYQELQKWSDAFEYSTVHRNSLMEWLRWEELNPVEGMNWRQRLYWEQRNGAWASAAQQALDLLDSIRIAPINCQYLLEILLSYPYELQTTKWKQHRIVMKCCPEIAGIPYGEPNSIFYKMKRKAKRIAVKLSGSQ